MLAPKKLKYRKQFRGIWRRIATKGHELNFGSWGLKSMSPGFVTDRQIESVRVILARATRKTGKFWMRIFPDRPYTKKPPEVTMGAGKGDVAYFVASICPGKIMFEIDGLTEVEARDMFRNISAKLPIKTKMVGKNNFLNS